MENRELRDRLRIADYLSERDRQDDGHASGNGPYPMRGSMTSEQYIIKLMQTIESLDSLVRDLRGEISFLHEELKRLREKDAEHDLERKRLMKLTEAKDQDIKGLTGQMGQMLTEMSCLRKALEDKTHQLTNRNRGQFGTRTNKTNAKKNLKGRDDDHEDYSASSDTDTEKQAEGTTDSAGQDAAVGKPFTFRKAV